MCIDVQTLVSIGLTENKAKETIKNKQLQARLGEAVEELSSLTTIDPSKGKLLYYLSTKLKSQFWSRAKFVVSYIASGKIGTERQLSAAIDYFTNNTCAEVDVERFEVHCGVGVEISEGEICAAVMEVIRINREGIVRGKVKEGFIIGKVNEALKWAGGEEIRRIVGRCFGEVVGSGETVEEQKETVRNGDNLMGECAKFHRPGENFKTEGYVITETTMKHMKDHLERTGGGVITRFPPEPNGILHIGHAKAINFNFGYARKHGGITYLRYDDTNPEKEEERFFLGIQDDIRWLGYTPCSITYASDYFPELYDLAVKMIKCDLAYVCHQSPEELKGINVTPSPWRNRPMSESLALFRQMKEGKLVEGEATLRMKHVMEDGKMDPVAYRIKYSTHYRTGDDWCIYPTYDFTHCLCDSIEDITHSLCTKEFQSRRSSYYFLCNAVDVYCPVQWEYSRLNLYYSVVSKRKIGRLIDAGLVKDWDDPRLFTLSALRRRGIPPEAVNHLCDKVGVTMTMSHTDPSLLDACARDALNTSSPRTMVVLNPLKVTISNWDALSTTPYLKVPNFPSRPTEGVHSIAFSSTVFIEKDDFNPTPPKDFKRLTLTSWVGLKYTDYMMKVVDHRDDEITVECCPLDSSLCSSFIHWVANPTTCTVRLYSKLFKHKMPEDRREVPDGFMSDVDSGSLVEKDALCDSSLSGVAVGERFQFERIGYFVVDRDSTEHRTVFNRTITLREDKLKN